VTVTESRALSIQTNKHFIANYRHLLRQNN